MKTAFTIIVPMYNVGREIHRCLSSLRTQTYPEFEVLLLDDGSTDDTVSICRETAARDSRFRLIENPHHGTASPLRNLGIRLASKEYIVFLDGDDEILADSLECFSSAVERYGAPDVLGAGVCSGSLNAEGVFQENGRAFNFSSRDGVRTGIQALERLFLQHKTLACYSCGNIYRRQFLIGKQLFQREDIRLLEDHEWLPRVLLSADRVAAVEHPYYHYIRRPGSVTTALTDRGLEDIAGVVNSLAAYGCAYQERMPETVRRFWAAHALNAFFWYFFYPLYEDKFTFPVWRSKLELLLGNPEYRKNLFRLFRYASKAKQLALPWILLARKGIRLPVNLYFRQFYYRFCIRK